MKRTAAVIVTYNRKAMLQRCLRLGLLVAAGAGSYFAMLFAQGFRPRDFARRSLS